MHARSEGEGTGDAPVVSFLRCLAAPSESSLPLPRLLLVLAHSDDEVLALGGRLERLRASRLLTITDGAPGNGMDAEQHGFASLEAYRWARREEQLAALADAGLSPEMAPVFPAAVADQAASLHMTALVRAIAEAIREFAPEAVLTHPYEGGHPDHDACAFAVHAAIRLLRESRESRHSVCIVEAPSYHADGYGGMVTGGFLQESLGAEIVRCALSEPEQATKLRRMACFASQAATLAQFGVGEELFREAPAYDFTQRPHPGQLFYEQFPWGMRGDRFCALAAEAMRALFAGGGPPASDAGRNRGAAG